jgi:hypothetical protein
MSDSKFSKLLAIVNKNNHPNTFSAELKVTGVPASVPDTSVLAMIGEAQQIIAGTLDKAPTVEHLQALNFSRMFWEQRAKDLRGQTERMEALLERLKEQADDFAGKFFGPSFASRMFRFSETTRDPQLLMHIPELESDCERCRNRAQYALSRVNQLPEMLCEAHAKEQPEWTGARVQ